MLRLLTLLTIATLAQGATAQTFLDGLRNTTGPSGAVVTVTQSKEIDRLVNGTKTTTSTTSASSSSAAAATTKPTTTKPATTADDDDSLTTDEGDASSTITGTTHKIQGYRVQVFAGGNTRDDKNKAYKAGDFMKKYFPEQPVYVHFYSPRWKCLIGNFRTYNEAAEVMSEVRSVGYRQACVVKAKIVVTE